MKRTLLSFGLLVATLSGHAQEAQLQFHADDLKALEAFVKSYPDYYYMVNYWDDMMYYQDVQVNDKFGVKWTEVDGQKRVTKLQINNTMADEKAMGEINLNGFSALKEVVIKSAGVHRVDASSVAALKSVEIRNNNLEWVDLPATLNSLSLYENPNYTNGDFTKYTALTGLYLMSLPVEEVKIASPELLYLTAQNTPVKFIDLSIAREKLNRIVLSGSPIEGMVFDGFDNLAYLTLEDCGLTSVPLANMKCELNLTISGNQIEDLDLSQLPKIKALSAIGCGIKTIRFSPESVALGNINLTDNEIERIDISGWNYQSSATGMLRLTNNPLTEFTTHPNVKSLYLAECRLTSLDLSASSILNALDCKNNQLTFTSVKLPKYNSRFILSPQDSIPVAKTGDNGKFLNPGDMVDLSHCVSPADGETLYQWYKLNGTKWDPAKDIPATDEPGKFMMPQDATGTYYCKVSTTTPMIANMYLVTEKFDLTTTSGMSQQKSLLAVYPNPVVDYLTIEGCANQSVEVFNAAGLSIYRAYSTQDALQVNTAAWEKGIYIVKVGSETYKLTKNN